MSVEHSRGGSAHSARRDGKPIQARRATGLLSCMHLVVLNNISKSRGRRNADLAERTQKARLFKHFLSDLRGGIAATPPDIPLLGQPPPPDPHDGLTRLIWSRTQEKRGEATGSGSRRVLRPF